MNKSNSLFPKHFILALTITAATQNALYAQTDSTARDSTVQENRLDSFLLRQKGIIGDLAKNLINDDTIPANKTVIKNDRLFERYRGKIIRNIEVRRVEFGTPITDTSKKFTNTLTRLGNVFHHNTRENVIRHNLFFKENGRIFPFLIADNERHLRDLEYLQDARIQIRPVRNSPDSVDVVVFTKDVLSIGGSFHMHSITNVDVEAREDNFAGLGDRLQIGVLYDNVRNNKLGYATEYIKRNIAGSFIDGYAGFTTFNKSFNTGRRDETMAYVRFIKPLVNQYMQWTYALEVANHTTQNMYLTDSVYQSEIKYKYFNTDAWIGWNLSADKLVRHNAEQRLRSLIGLRYINQHFQQVPDKYAGDYHFRYANIYAVLGSFSVFKLDYYKTNYIYGFGRTEDVPEGIDISFTTGYTQKNRRERPYIGLDFQRFYFTMQENYFIYTARVGSFFYNRKFEDVDVLLNLDFFTRLRQLSNGWKLRTFISAGITKQFNEQLNQPLFLDSPFGLHEYRSADSIAGNIRGTLKAESVFFTPWRFLSFRFAPFVFGNASFLNAESGRFAGKNFFSSVGGGLRTRNESLIFGTIELKGYYFPTKNFRNQQWRIEVNTNIKFKYNRQLLKRPQFIEIN